VDRLIRSVAAEPRLRGVTPGGVEAVGDQGSPCKSEVTLTAAKAADLVDFCSDTSPEGATRSAVAKRARRSQSDGYITPTATTFFKRL